MIRVFLLDKGYHAPQNPIVNSLMTACRHGPRASCMPAGGCLTVRLHAGAPIGRLVPDSEEGDRLADTASGRAASPQGLSERAGLQDISLNTIHASSIKAHVHARA